MPKLRFKDEKGQVFPEWEEKRFDKCFPLQRGFDLPIATINTGKYPVVFSNGILKFHNIYKVKGPGVTTGRSGTIGKVFYVKQHFWPHNTSLWVTNFYNNSSLFTYYYFLFFHIERFASGSTVPTLNRNDLHAQKVITPSFDEQEKIAGFLSVVDQKLGLHRRKAERLSHYKKGIMQKIFSQRLCFKDNAGNEFSEWETKKLGDVGKIVTGKTPSTQNKELWVGNIPFVTPTDIKDCKYQYTTERMVSNSLMSLPKGTIMYTCIASIGKMSIATKNCITNQQINSLLINNASNNEYVYYALQHKTPFIRSTKANTTLPIINKTEFSKITINLPTLPEQEKIANFLSALDDKITEVQQSISHLEKWKKGLLQQLFI